MANRAILSKLRLATFTKHTPWTVSLCYFNTAENPVFSVSSRLHHNVKTGINTRFQARPNYATMARPLTDADRARCQAYSEALTKALGEIPEYDADRVREAWEATKQAHPIDPAVQEACWKERLGETPTGFLDSLDSIKEALNDERLKPDTRWGLVVYRTSYGNEAAWQHILAEIHEHLENSIDVVDRADLLARHQLVVMDDGAQFDGATIDQVREHFRGWSLDELRQNWRCQPMPGDEVARVEASSSGGADSSAGARYNFCLVVDDLCLESVDKMSSPVLKLVDKRWEPYELEVEDTEDDGENPGWEGGVTNSEFEDVGWMYMEVGEYVNVQNDLHERDNWVDDYLRPPLMRWVDFEDTPVYWRRDAKSFDRQ